MRAFFDLFAKLRETAHHSVTARFFYAEISMVFALWCVVAAAPAQ